MPTARRWGNSSWCSNRQTARPALPTPRPRFAAAASWFLQLEQNAPEPIADDVANYSAAYDEYAHFLDESGYNLDVVFSTPAGQQLAIDTSHSLTPSIVEYAIDECGLSFGDDPDKRSSEPPPPASSESETAARSVSDPGDLYAIELTHMEVTRITTDPRLEGAPSFTPDGRIRFGRLESGSDPATGNTELYIMDSNGGNERNISNNPAHDETARATADGLSMVFSSDRNGNPEIYVAHIDGTRTTRLTNDPNPDRFPAVSPDGSLVAFSSIRNGDEDLFVMGIDGSAVRQLTETPGLDWLPAFRRMER